MASKNHPLIVHMLRTVQQITGHPPELTCIPHWRSLCLHGLRARTSGRHVLLHLSCHIRRRAPYVQPQRLALLSSSAVFSSP
mmetsp:Transcript_26442/g.71437  ORF Transcript_26442/g.71437 Transcript_26442/m.71437 type:complete len:82 (-) Transcript_26442:622-867(-)